MAIIAGMHGMVAEGVLTTNAAIGLAKKMGVEMPITEQMHAILQQGKSPKEAIRDLMSRPSTSEAVRPGLIRLTSRHHRIKKCRQKFADGFFRHHGAVEHVLHGEAAAKPRKQSQPRGPRREACGRVHP